MRRYGNQRHRRSWRKARDFFRYGQRRPGQELYRSRKGKILGVCAGLGEYFDLSVTGIRVVAVILLIVTGFWPVLAVYFLAAILMKLKPILPLEDEGDEEFYNSYLASRSMALKRLKRTYDHLDRRIRRMEDIVTTREYDWERRFNG